MDYEGNLKRKAREKTARTMMKVRRYTLNRMTEDEFIKRLGSSHDFRVNKAFDVLKDLHRLGIIDGNCVPQRGIRK